MEQVNINEPIRKTKRRRLGFKITLGVILLIILGAGLYVFSVYSSINHALNLIHKPLGNSVTEYRGQTVDLAKKEPFSLLLLGVDRRAHDYGRSDSMILLIINPADRTVKEVSIPRDTYTEIAGTGKKDKINAAYESGGTDMAVKTVENFLNIPIDFYIEINMQGFKDIVDAVGSVTVNNTLAFIYEGKYFPTGTLRLNGEDALKYSRMRIDDPDGDFGRQKRQRQIIQEVIHEGINVKTLANYGTILNAISKNVTTNLTFDQMRAIDTNYKDATHHIDQIRINGSGKDVHGIYYYFVPESVRSNLSHMLNDQLNVN